jgi:hypothetical protein
VQQQQEVSAVFADQDLVCYCFGYTAGQIREDARNNQGRSLILARILAARNEGGCRCAERKPKGR